MQTADKNELRVCVLKQLSVMFGIKLKLKALENHENSRTPAHSQVKVFNVPVQNLQMIHVAEYGLVPCFLVDACKYLLNHASSEGLFRKSGSVVRLKALRSRLDEGENCLSAALPCDVASLVKQFFKELPQPIFPPVLLQAFNRSQQLASEKHRSIASQLVSCLLPDTNKSILQFFFVFLRQISLRSSENKMDSYNLSVVFTPTLFHLYGTEWNDGCYRLYIEVICTFIENAHTFAVVPDTIFGKDPSVVESNLLNEKASRFGWKNNGRKSLNVSLLRKAQTPGSEEMMLNDVDVFPSKKQKSLRRSLGMVPGVLSGNCTDSSTQEQESSPSVLWNRRLSNSARRSCARVCKTVKRVVSETVCCGTSSPGDNSSFQSPVASCWLEPYQDTPVSVCLKRCYHEQERDPIKSRPIPSVFKTLFCSSARNSPEDQQLLTQDGTSPIIHSSNAGQRPVNTDKNYIHPVGCSNSKCMEKQPSKLGLVVTDVDDCNNVRVSTDEADTGEVHLKQNLSDTPKNPKVKVVDRIRNYSRLKPAVPKVRSPLKFNRTPVYQYVKRINSCLITGRLIK